MRIEWDDGGVSYGNDEVVSLGLLAHREGKTVEKPEGVSTQSPVLQLL